MRLSEVEKKAILDTVKSVDPSAIVMLFGSRVAIDKKGGDIDLLIESNAIGFKEKQLIRLGIQKIIGEQKIDILVTQDIANSKDPFIATIKNKAIKI